MNRFEEELLEKARAFLKAAGENAESRAFLEEYGFKPGEQQRGRDLVANAERSFEWEREGKAWNFLSPTVERRMAEARHWYKDQRRRHLTGCFRAFGESMSPRHLLRALSPSAWQPTSTGPPDDASRFARETSGGSFPHGNRRLSGVEAASSHSASVGRRRPAQRQYASASNQQTWMTGSCGGSGIASANRRSSHPPPLRPLAQGRCGALRERPPDDLSTRRLGRPPIPLDDVRVCAGASGPLSGSPGDF